MGETFCFADPQVEGRGVLRIWVYGDTDNALASSDQQLRDCDMVDPGCDGEPTVEGRYVYTATDGVCSLLGCQLDSFHDGVIEYMDVSIDRKRAVTDNDTATSVYRHWVKPVVVSIVLFWYVECFLRHEV